MDYTINGIVASTTGAPIPSVVAVAYNRQITGDIVLGQSVTDADGNYTITFNSDKLQLRFKPDIEVRVVIAGTPAVTAAAAATTVLGKSEIRYNAGPQETINVIINTAAVPRASEYDRLATDLQPHLGNIALKDLQENANNTHVTLLSNKTGWDARAVAMAAQANKLSATTSIPAVHYYAMFRAGLPSDNETLSRLPSDALQSILTQATKDKLIPQADIQATIKTFNAQSANYLLHNSAAFGVSNLGTMLSLRLNADQQNIFAESYREAAGNSDQLWSTLKARGIADDTIGKLQLDGKLGYLTLQNAPLVKKLYDTFQVADPIDLVKKGLYSPAAWKDLVGNDLPPGITAENYATSMSNLLTLSYPTAVTAEMVRNKEITLHENAPLEDVYTFLNDNKQNTLGVNPVKQWENYKQAKPETQTAVKQVERLFQLSPSNASMTALSSQQLTSAYDIVQYSREEFMSKYSKAFPNTTEASLTYTRAQEVYSTVTNVASAYTSYRTLPNIYALTGKTEKTEGDIIAYPTMEELFGNMDYCSCDECKSILGAAAYMVDLLHFIDLSNKPHDLQNPLDILLTRRPDIQHMQLTCENTNTVLPYIDIVNEILEYYIANGSLTGFTGHDITADTDTNDLLADPQYVIASAYDKTGKEVYPFTLPFDKAREALRLFFKAWDTTQETALLNFGNPLAARKERMGLNLVEYDIFTNINLHTLPEYFGEAPATTLPALNTAISNAKVFTRRVDITDNDLVNLLKTQFINPGITLTPLLDQLQVAVDKIQAYYDGTLSDNDLNNLLPAGFDTTPYGGAVGTWLKNNRDLIGKLILLTDMTPDTDDCSLAGMELRYLLPPDATKNQLDEIAWHKLHRFIRLWKKTGWNITTLDRVMTTFLPTPSKDLTTGNIDAAFVTLLARMAGFKRLVEALSLSDKKMPTLLTLWDGTLDLAGRQIQCAQLFKMSVNDLLDLAKITGLDPLAADLGTDEPAILRLLKITANMKAVPVKTVDLSYLLMNKDLAGKLTPDASALLKQVKSLRDALSSVEKDNTIAPDNADLSFVKTRLTLVYDSSVVDALFGLLTNSRIYSSTLNLPEESLPAPLTVNPQMGYDAFKKLLTYTGVLTAAAQTALDTAADGLTLADVTDITQQADLDTFKTNFKQALVNIKTASDGDITTLATGYPELKTVYDTVMAQPTPAQQATALINGILPALIDQLKAGALRQTLAAILKADTDSVTALTSNAGVVHSLLDTTKNVLNDFTGLETTVPFSNSQTYDGYLDAPASDDYILFIKAPANTTVTLSINGTPVINAVVIGAPGETQTALPVTLQAGLPTLFQLTLAGLPAATTATIWWRTKGMAKTQVPVSNIYTKANIDSATTSLVRLSNISRLQQLMKLTAPEVIYFASVNPATKDLFNNLPANGTITDPDLHTLWSKVNWLIFFTLLKSSTEQEENSWLHILQQPTVTTLQGKSLLLDMNSWQQADVDAVLTHFGKTWVDIFDLAVLQRLVWAMQLVTDINLPAASVIAWSVDNPDNNLIETIKTTLRSRTDSAAWQDTMKSVSDVMRNLQRDALIAYILHHLQPLPQVDTADKLYEYFLIDVQMDACMLTSRIVQATATIQLFIYRCLMNLELQVSPSSIRADQWAWMQRYRVWQANRKIFLYPENWLDPELRDNKSSFYTELEGELMQADITDELAETAYLNYLKKLDDVARLEITGMYLQENEQGNPNDDILHVFGRTNGNTRQYYYRKFAYGYWTPWEKIGLTIEGDHIFPVIWKTRLFLFWLNIVEKAKEENRNQNPNDMAKVNWGNQVKKDVEVNMCWGEYYKGKWTSPKSSELKEPIVIPDLTAFDAHNILLYARKEQPNPKNSEHLIFYFFYVDSGLVAKTVTFTSKNAPPIIDDISTSDSLLNQLILFNYELFRKVYEGTNPSLLNFTQLKVPSNQLKVLIDQPDLAAQETLTESILTKKAGIFGGFRLLPLRHLVENQWQAPFVYLDEQSVFMAQPAEIDTPPIWRYLGYYDLGVYATPKYTVDIPPLVEKPVLTKPPREEFFNPQQPVVDPSEWQQIITSANSNYKVVLPSDSNFSFDQATFGVGGKLQTTALQGGTRLGGLRDIANNIDRINR